MPAISKKKAEAREKIDRAKKYGIEEGLDTLLSAAYAKFEESVDVAVRLGVDPRHADQMVRGTCVLPHGTGKTVRVLVFAKGEKEKEAHGRGRGLCRIGRPGKANPRGMAGF